MDAGVDVVPWLRPWWDLWTTVTHALWWPAWSAVFSGLAFAFTIRLANSNARQARQRDAAFILGTATIVGVIVASVGHCLGPDPHNETWDQQLNRLARYIDSLRLVETLHGVDVTKFPTAASLKAFLEAKIVIDTIVNIADGNARTRTRQFLANRLVELDRQFRAMLTEARKLGGDGAVRAAFGDALHRRPLTEQEWIDAAGR